MAAVVSLVSISWPALAATCVVAHAKLLQALKANVKASGGPSNGGMENNEWAVVVARDGTVCAVAFTGNVVGDQWPASRAIAAEKANTANGMSMAKYATFGSQADPMMGKQLGGAIAYGGGLALYDTSGIVGALGVSGDTPCADHNVAWRVRHALGMDRIPAGPNGGKNDGIIYDIDARGKSASGFGHPRCGGTSAAIAVKIGAGSEPHGSAP